MVSRILTAIQKKYTSVTEAAFIISFFTFMSQLLGVIRDRLFAYYIGPGCDMKVKKEMMKAASVTEVYFF